MIDREKIRISVIKSLPEANEIKNKELREKIYDAWTLALIESGFEKIEEMGSRSWSNRLSFYQA